MNKRKFTLIELMAVIAIIAILGGMVLGIAGFARKKSAETKTTAILEMFRQGLEQYKLKYGYYPQTGGTYQKLATDYMNDSDTGAASATNEKNNLNQFLDIDFFKANGTRENGSSNTYRLLVLDGFGIQMYYCCPGNFNTESYDLMSAGQDGFWGEETSATAIEGKTITPGTGKTNAATAGKGDDMTNFKR